MALILYIEDNDANQNLMKSIFKRLKNHELLLAKHAEEGLQMMEQILPEIVLMDINLPGMNGLEAIDQIKKMDIQQPKMIAVSANAMQIDIDAAEEAGFDDYLIKPLDINKLLLALNL